jgi:hypothetical protein
MSFIDFGKRREGLWHHFLKTEKDGRGDVPQLKISKQFGKIMNINIRVLNNVFCIVPSSNKTEFLFKKKKLQTY